MNRKIALVCFALFVLPAVAMPGAAAPVLDTKVSPAEVMSEIGRIVRKEFYDRQGLGAFNDAEQGLRRAAASGEGLSEVSEEWLATLKASHTARLTPDTVDYYEIADVFAGGLRDELKRLFPPKGEVTYQGIGIATAEIGGKIFVTDVYDGSAAAAAGLRAGDEILAVDGRPFAPIASFQRKAGRNVEIEVRRKAAGPSIHLPVEVRTLQPAETFNEAIRRSVRVVDQYGARIGYMRIWSFASRGVEDVVMDLLTSEPLKGVDGLVLDMRGRWGGAPPDATDLFVGRSPTMVVIDHDGDDEMLTTSWRKPVVGIIDGGSRSGMEILAHGLKQAGVPLIGTRTAGDVLAGRAFMLKDYSILEIAVLDVHVDGKRIEGNGVMPNIEVPFDVRYADGADPQFSRAVEEMGRLLREGGGETKKPS